MVRENTSKMPRILKGFSVIDKLDGAVYHEYEFFDEFYGIDPLPIIRSGNKDTWYFIKNGQKIIIDRERFVVLDPGDYKCALAHIYPSRIDLIIQEGR